jgi:FAD/FMN-containing dehydrogenase
LIEANIPFKAHGGGHTIKSTIAAPGVLIDTSLMKGIKIMKEKELVEIQAGTRLGELTEALAKEEMVTSKSNPK